MAIPKYIKPIFDENKTVAYSSPTQFAVSNLEAYVAIPDEMIKPNWKMPGSVNLEFWHEDGVDYCRPKIGAISELGSWVCYWDTNDEEWKERNTAPGCM